MMIDKNVYNFKIVGANTEGMSAEETNKFLSRTVNERADKRFDATHPLRREEILEIAVVDESRGPLGISVYDVKVVPSGSETYQV